METGLIKKDENLVKLSRIADDSGKVDVSRLSEADKKRCREITKGITDLQSLYSYGTDIVSAKNEATNQLLEHSKIDKAGQVGAYITEALDVIRDTEYEDPSTMKGVRGVIARIPVIGKFLVKTGDKYIIDRYDNAKGVVDKVVGCLKQQQIDLKADYNTIDIMVEKTQAYVDQLGVLYVALAQLYADKEAELAEMRRINKEDPGTYSDAQIIAAQGFLDEIFHHQYELFLAGQYNQNILCPSLEKMKQNAQNLFKNAEQITKVVIPNWEVSISMALINNRQQKISEIQTMVKDKNNEMILANANMLKNVTVALEKESRRGAIDAETYIEARKTVISALEESFQSNKQAREEILKSCNEIAAANRESDKRLAELAENFRKFYVEGEGAVVSEALRNANAREEE